MIKQDYIILSNELSLYVGKEIYNAIDEHGLQEFISVEKQYLITAEEFGEIAHGILEKDTDNVKMEIIQTMAMLVKLFAVVERDEKDEKDSII